MVDKVEEKDVAELTDEERAKAWEEWVKSEVNAALDIFLPKANKGNINLSYYPHVVDMLEAGPETDDTKADGVLISIVFGFEEPLDLSKERDI